VSFYGNDITGMVQKPGERRPPNWFDFIQKRGKFFRDVYSNRLEQLLQEAHCCTAISEFIRSKLIEQGCPPEKIVVHYVGVDLEQFKADPKVPREPIVLFVGRLVEKKGCEYLIRAMAKVQAESPEAELVVIGDGPLRSTLEAQAQNSLKRYRFLGAQSPEVVQAWMNRAWVFSVPSIIAQTGDAEGFGMVFTEAQAMQLPVVSFATGGIPEAVAHDRTGFLASEGDWETLAKYLLRFFQDYELRERFAVEGRRWVEQEFDLKRNTLKLDRLYDRVLEGQYGSVEVKA
jgi:glycosyltransferase involved in cell wall biosynthesis